MAYEIDNPEIKVKLDSIGKLLASDMPKGWGFMLMLYEFNGESLFYISNGKRENVIDVMKEFIAKFDKKDAA